MHITSLTYDARDQAWMPLNQLQQSIPAAVTNWINQPGSLTQALRDKATHFNVQVLEQSWVEATALAIGLSQTEHLETFFSRKVLLCNADTPWVAAHTLIPQSSLDNGLSALINLKSQPLGELLFASQDVRKDNLEACDTQIGWARRTRYFLQSQPLIVSEYFLPDLIKHEQNCD